MGGGIFESGPRTERQTISFSSRSGARSASARSISAEACRLEARGLFISVMSIFGGMAA